MLDNFDTIKTQLKELSEIINAFKSESVQLRIIDLIFKKNIDELQQSLMDDTASSSDDSEHKKSVTKKPKRKGKSSSSSAKTKSSSSAGPKGTVEELISEGFFKQSRAISEIIEHCKTIKARVFKTNDISPALARLIREKKLTREKNTDGQFEYKQ